MDLSEFDPLKRPSSNASRPAHGEVFDPEAVKFGQLTGLDVATAAVQIKAAKLKGMSFEEAVDRFYANNKAHVREGDAVDRRRALETQRKKETQESDAALARAMAEESREKTGSEATVEDVVDKLREMGFAQGIALKAAQNTNTLADAAEYCVNGGRPRPRRESANGGDREARFAAEGERRKRALTVNKTGKLYKLARATSYLGPRWQSRQFVLRECGLSYQSSGEKKKTIPVWNCYAVRLGEKVLGKEYSFALYGGDRGPPSTDAKPVALLASDDERQAQSWLLAIMLASGRPGHVLRNDETYLRCTCVLPFDAAFQRDLSVAVSESRKVVVTKAAGQFQALGLRVDDIVVSVDDKVAADDQYVMQALKVAPRPFEMIIRRQSNKYGQPTTTRPTPSLPSQQYQQAASGGQIPTLDLLSLDLDFEEEEEPPAPSPPAQPQSQDGQRDQALSLVGSAIASQNRGLAHDDPKAARAEFAAVVQTLLSVQPIYEQNRDAVAAAFPQVDLATLYNDAVSHAQRCDALIANQNSSIPAQPPIVASHKAAYAFEAAEPWQLSVELDEPLQVVETLPDGWSDCVNSQRQRGLVPSSYVVPT